MVRQPIKGVLAWSLPGGVAEQGESLLEALKREIEEESGVLIHDQVDPAYEIEMLDEQGSCSASIHAFSVHAQRAEILINDPDKHIVEAAWVPMNEAIEKLTEVPIAMMRDPAIAYLREGKHFCWKYDSEGSKQI